MTGLLGDLDTNGVNDFFFNMEASIERVNLITIWKTIEDEYIVLLYAPSYDLAEEWAQSFDW